MMELCILATIS